MYADTLANLSNLAAVVSCARYRVYKFPGALLRVSCPLIQIIEENRGFPGVYLPFLFAFLCKICIPPFLCSFSYRFHSFFVRTFAHFANFISLASLWLRSFFVGILWHFREFIGSSTAATLLPLFLRFFPDFAVRHFITIHFVNSIM